MDCEDFCVDEILRGCHVEKDSEGLLCWERLRAGGEQTKEDEMVGWHHRLNGHEFE